MYLISHPVETPNYIKGIFVKGIKAQDDEEQQHKLLEARAYIDEW